MMIMKVMIMKVMLCDVGDGLSTCHFWDIPSGYLTLCEVEHNHFKNGKSSAVYHLFSWPLDGHGYYSYVKSSKDKP